MRGEKEGLSLWSFGPDEPKQEVWPGQDHAGRSLGIRSVILGVRVQDGTRELLTVLQEEGRPLTERELISSCSMQLPNSEGSG